LILFEATTSFGTAGLSMELAPELSPFGQVLITMFAGRVGPLTIAYAATLHGKPDPFRYPKRKIMIG
jgi:trk system potassium uptake protein TrkH